MTKKELEAKILALEAKVIALEARPFCVGHYWDCNHNHFQPNYTPGITYTDCGGNTMVGTQNSGDISKYNNGLF